jgi:methyl-accepting chemotaxis protein WspA
LRGSIGVEVISMTLFAKLSISTKLHVLFALLAVITVACATITIRGLRQQELLANDVGSAYLGARYVEKINGLIYAVVMESRGIYMSSDLSTARPFVKNLLDFNERIENVVEEWHGTLHPEDVTQFDGFARRIGQFVGFRKELGRIGSEVSTAAGREWGDNEANRNVRSALNKDLEALAKVYAGRLTRLVTELEARSTRMVWEVSLLAFFAAVLAGIGVVIIRRNVLRPLAEIAYLTERVAAGAKGIHVPHDARQDEIGALSRSIGVFQKAMDDLIQLTSSVQRIGIQVGTSVTAIAATAKQQQATATEIAATTIDMGATSKEISATSKELVRTMSEVSMVAEQTATLASSGQAGLSRMEVSMPQVMEAAGSINAKLAVLNEKAGNINQVVTTIAKVADQTNLLSLNAAIEAEKAGEYGRGFSVVAAEIRRLADQTAVATYDIEQMVKEIQSAISAGLMGMDKFSEEVRRGIQDVQQVGSQLSQIIQQVQALVPRFETVNEGVRAQATGAEQISEALQQLTEAAQQTVESLRQSTSAIDELNQVSGNLRSSVSRIKLEA